MLLFVQNAVALFVIFQITLDIQHECYQVVTISCRASLQTNKTTDHSHHVAGVVVYELFNADNSGLSVLERSIFGPLNF